MSDRELATLQHQAFSLEQDIAREFVRRRESGTLAGIAKDDLPAIGAACLKADHMATTLTTKLSMALNTILEPISFPRRLAKTQGELLRLRAEINAFLPYTRVLFNESGLLDRISPDALVEAHREALKREINISERSMR